jgi:hypothetical protein
MSNKICRYCKKEILGDPIILEGMYQDSRLEEPIEYKKFFCSEVCEYADEILTHTVYYNYNASRIINHLISQHGCRVDVLEKALNEVKKYLVFDGFQIKGGV